MVMDLKESVPPLPTELVTALRSCGIVTDMDFLFSGPVDDLLAKLSPNTVTRDELVHYVAKIAERAAAPVSTGTERYTQALGPEKQAFDFSTGIPDLDTLLNGFGGFRVIELSGQKGSGKTALALHLALKHLSEVPDSGVLWIDTSGDFEAEKGARWLAIAQGQAAGNTALERLQVSMPLNDVEEADTIIEHLRLSLSNPALDGLTTRCLVIDTVTKLFSSRLIATSSQGHAIMTKFMRQLRSLARNCSVTIFVINDTSFAHPYNPQSTSASTLRKPSLGPTFTFLTDACLWLAKSDADQEGNDDPTTTHFAEVLRSRTTRSGTWCTFKIRDGIHLLA